MDCFSFSKHFFHLEKQLNSKRLVTVKSMGYEQRGMECVSEHS